MRQEENKTKRPEILAPAGSAGQLTAAVLCGADAVYFGVQGFNARAGAQNFTTENLTETVDYCHLRGVKVYLTVNTLVLPGEMDDALFVIQKACEAGVDAVLVQDLGLARLAHAAAPALALHASTQMSLHNADGVNLLAPFGYTRAVLARELSEKEILHINEKATIETEMFLHGALCFCLSGQCYLSAVAGERSGNRGLCAQPCRLPFYKTDEREHAMSLKDLSLIPQIDRAAATGVAALKIEGRMKRPEYVAGAVTAAKDALNGEPVNFDDLQAVFSRSGFTDGYFTGRLGREMLGTRQKEDVTAATPQILKKFEALYAKEKGRVAVSMAFTGEAGRPCTLAVQDADGNRVQVEGEIPQQALTKETTEEMLRQNLQKLGGTPFFAEKCEVHFAPGHMLPVSQINALRRAAIEKLTQIREKPKSIPFTMPKAEAFPPVQPGKKPALRVRLARPEQLAKEYWEYVQQIILPVDILAKMPVTGYEHKLAAGLPPALFDEEKLEKDLLACREKGIKMAMTGNLGGILPARRLGFSVIGDFGLNVTNVHSLARLKEMGVSEAVLSIEMTLADGVKIAPVIPRGVFAYGRLPVMTARNCPAAASGGCADCAGFTVMKDRGGREFMVDCGGKKDAGHSAGAQIYNFRPVYLADRLAHLGGLDFMILYFTDEGPAAVGQTIRAYQTGAPSPGDITRGLYYRGVK